MLRRPAHYETERERQDTIRAMHALTAAGFPPPYSGNTSAREPAAPPKPQKPTPYITRYDDVGEDEETEFGILHGFGVVRQVRPPWWYDPKLRRCACDLDVWLGLLLVELDNLFHDRGGRHLLPLFLCPAEQWLVYDHEGYSDSHLRRWRCSACGREWSDYLEG